ncbi:MAG: hypothetical protein U0X91_08595 [Spirosomataceae bacterium]
MNTDLDAHKLRVRLTGGLQKAILKMIERAKALDEEIVIADRNGNVKHIKAKELKQTKP